MTGRTWREKPGPIATTGRAIHAVLGALLPLLAGHLGGYSACAWAVIGALALGTGWELLTPVLAGPLGWDWPHADLIDLLAWPFGAALGACSWLALRGRRLP
jgi:hypothetical protein